MRAPAAIFLFRNGSECRAACRACSVMMTVAGERRAGAAYVGEINIMSLKINVASEINEALPSRENMKVIAPRHDYIMTMLLIARLVASTLGGSRLIIIMRESEAGAAYKASAAM